MVSWLLEPLFTHRHKWVDTGWNQWSIATEQKCKCGEYRHHLFVDVAGDSITWRSGKHPKYIYQYNRITY